MDLRELQKMIKLAKKAGLSSLKVDGIELVFSPESLRSDIKGDIDNTSTPDKEDPMKVLMWSVQDVDPLKEAN